MLYIYPVLFDNHYFGDQFMGTGSFSKLLYRDKTGQYLEGLNYNIISDKAKYDGFLTQDDSKLTAIESGVHLTIKPHIPNNIYLLNDGHLYSKGPSNSEARTPESKIYYGPQVPMSKENWPFGENTYIVPQYTRIITYKGKSYTGMLRLVKDGVWFYSFNDGKNLGYGYSTNKPPITVFPDDVTIDNMPPVPDSPEVPTEMTFTYNRKSYLGSYKEKSNGLYYYKIEKSTKYGVYDSNKKISVLLPNGITPSTNEPYTVNKLRQFKFHKQTTASSVLTMLHLSK